MMSRLVPVLLLFLLAAAFKAGESFRLQEWFGLRLPSKSRELQDGIFPLCASAFSGRNGHLLANLNSKGKVLQKWVPVPDEDFQALVNLNAGTFTLIGTLIPKGAKNLDNALNVNFVYSDPVSFTSCYCASVEFLGDLTDIDYSLIEKKCNLDNFLARPASNADQVFCPTCEANQCTVASKDPTAPNPIYSDWLFFQEVSGSLTGPGISLFYELISKGFDTEGEFDQCTPDITNQPLPQLGCNNFADPDEGKGFGANGKNQKCGLASWFNCEELLDQLGGENIRVHVADINLELEPCPPEPLTPSPTLPIITTQPTVSPTDSPTESPTVSPTPAPTESPTVSPTPSPTVSPTPAPTGSPTVSPTPAPTTSPTTTPTDSPTVSPTPAPTDSPTVSPTPAPTTGPTPGPTDSPTVSPTLSPTPCPRPKPCRKVKVCVPCKFFPDVETCEEEFENLDWEDWLEEDPVGPV